MQKPLFAALAALAATAALAAPPTVKYGNVTFNEPATAEEIAAAKAEVLVQAKGSTAKATVTLKGTADDATLAAAVAAFPDAKRFEVDCKNTVSSIAPFAGLTAAKSVAANNILNLDVSPLAGLVTVEKVSLKYSQVSDLAPLAQMPNLKELDVYGATLADFSPLAAAPKLELVYYYAAKMPAAGYDSLGTLKQVRKFHGGLTKMTSLAWLRNVPQIEELKIFSEDIKDLTPILDCPNLTYFRGWNMDGGRMAPALGDLSFLANAKKLQTLELPGSAYTSTAVIGTLTNLKTLDLTGAKNPIDTAFLASLPGLKSLSLPKAQFPKETTTAESLGLPKGCRLSVR